MNAAGMPLVAALALAGASAAILAVLHLLRVRPRPLRVVTTLFWQQAIEQPRARTLRHRFRHPRTYALLALIAALLAFALARPQISGSGTRVTEVIVVDGGLAMGARDSSSANTRLAEAAALVLDEAGRLALTDNVAVVLADPGPRLLHDFDEPRALLRRALAGAAPAASPAQLSESVALGRTLLRGRPNSRLLLVTDRPPAAEEIAAAGSIEVRTALVGRPADNAGILTAQFEPLADDPLRGRFTVRIGYWGGQPREVMLRCARAGGAPLLSQAVMLAPGTTQDVNIADLAADGDELVVTLAPSDALPADDRMRFRLPLRQVVRVAVADDAPVALRLLLASSPAVQLVSALDAHDVAVIVGPLDSAPPGPAFVIAEGGPPVPPAPVDAVSGSPLTRGLSFDGAVCAAGSGLPALGTDAVNLLDSAGMSLAAWVEQEGALRCCLAPAILAADSELPRTPAFAVFTARVLRRLAGWEDTPLVLVPGMVQSFDRVGEAGLVPPSAMAPAARDASDTYGSSPDARPGPPLSPRRRALAEPSVLMLAAAFGLLLAEAVLHSRGRIP